MAETKRAKPNNLHISLAWEKGLVDQKEYQLFIESMLKIGLLTHDRGTNYYKFIPQNYNNGFEELVKHTAKTKQVNHLKPNAAYLNKFIAWHQQHALLSPVKEITLEITSPDEKDTLRVNHSKLAEMLRKTIQQSHKKQKASTAVKNLAAAGFGPITNLGQSEEKEKFGRDRKPSG